MSEKNTRIILDTNVLYAGLYSSKVASINQFISSSVSEKISALMTEDYLKSRAKRSKKDDFGKILAKVPGRKPVGGDEL
ncbi:MAG: hypothetical protein U0586_11470 [Candidatus Brocadiaceae bacterium]